MIQLFPDEQLLTQSSGGEVTLTTHRITYEYVEWGRSYNQSIMLEHITSCENKYNTQVWLIMLGALSLVTGLILSSDANRDAFTVSIFVALACSVIYWLTRSNLIIIASPSTRMYIKVNGMNRDTVLGFINKVEQAKHRRVMQLNNRGAGFN